MSSAKNVLIATEKPFSAAARDEMLAIMKGEGLTVTVLEGYSAKEDLKKAVATANGIIIRSDIIDEEVLAAAPDLKIVIRAGAGYDNIAESVRAKIVAENTPGQNANAVAELAFMLMVFVSRKQLSGAAGTEIKGKKLGLYAFGMVGKAMAAIAKGYGMEVLAYDAFVPADAIKAQGITPVASPEALFTECDFVSLHIPATPELIKSINATMMGKMKKGATLINTARAEVMNDEDLATILAERKDLKYVADVRPKNADAVLAAGGDRVYLTNKKQGAQTEEANYNAGTAAARQMVAFLNNGEVKYQVK